MSPEEFELTPDLIKHCRALGLDAVLELEAWKARARKLGSGTVIADPRKSFLSFVESRRKS